MTPTSAARLSNVNLLVRDVARAQDFYTRAFGLELDLRRSAPPSMLILKAVGCTLSLKAVETEDPDKRAGPGSVELGFETEDLEAVHAALTELGAFVTPIQEQGFGRTFDARDLDGHHLVVYTLRLENR
ncbi:MAG: VOC family protein [Deinococcota bacterium]